MKSLNFFSVTLVIMLLSTSVFSQIYVKSNGNVGIGTNNPTHKFQVNGRIYLTGNGNTFRILPNNPGTEIGTTTDKIDFWSSNTGHNKLYAQKFYKVSDSTLKMNILPVKNGLNTIMKLNSYSYYMKEDKENPILEYGFLSQEVEKVLPEITSMSKDILMIDYDQVIPILVEAVKEQQKQIEMLQKVVDLQEKDLIILKNNSNNIDNKTEIQENEDNIIDGDAKLYNNSPNPFNQETEIKYFIPENTVSARLLIYNLQGKEIKSYKIQHEKFGSIIINASELYAGMFIYTLVVDNKIIDTKRMILTSN